MKILVADGSPVMRRIMIRTLRQAGYAGHVVVEAASGGQALELLHTECPDLVLSEWNLPGMSGIDVLGRLRDAGSTVPFGFVTSDGSADMRARASAGGAQFLIAKPFTTEDVGQALSLVLRT